MYSVHRIAIVGIVSLLFACASDPNADLPESKSFKFSQADSERTIVPAAFAQYLINADDGTIVVVNDGTSAKVRLGEKYYSATGNLCRRFKTIGQDENEQVACLINEAWRKARPIMTLVPVS